MKSYGPTLRIFIFLLALLMAFTFTACAGADDPGDIDESLNNGSDGGKTDGMENAPQSGADNSVADRKIIKTVNERVETENYDAFIKSVQNKAAELGGYISSSNYSGSTDDTDRTAKFVVRIPADRLSEFTGAIGELATVTSYNESQQDVTLDYVDIISRIEVLEAEKTALTALLENAATTADILAIRAQLEDVIAELTSLKSQKNVYDSQVAYSTVYMSVFEVEKESAVKKPSYAEKLGSTFMSSLKGIGSFFASLGIVLIGGSPVILLLAAIGVGIYFAVRLITKLAAKKPAPPTNFPPQNPVQNNQPDSAVRKNNNN